MMPSATSTMSSSANKPSLFSTFAMIWHSARPHSLSSARAATTSAADWVKDRDRKSILLRVPHPRMALKSLSARAGMSTSRLARCTVNIRPPRVAALFTSHTTSQPATDLTVR